MKRLHTLLLTATMTGMVMMPAAAQKSDYKKVLRETKREFYKTEEARRIGDEILLYQRVTGGWPKNIDMTKPLTESEKQKVIAAKQRTDDSTTDNKATTTQMTYLARLYRETGDTRYSEAFCKGVEYLLSGQYENGGWPQFWPKMRDYQIHITYNDDAMVNTMKLLRKIGEQQNPYKGTLTTDSLRQRAMKAYYKGVECILATQIVVDGTPTIWCQQHDRVTLKPAKARAYELPSYCPMESARIVELLMSLPDPDERVKKAVHGAMKWLDKYKLTGLRLERTGEFHDAKTETRLVPDNNAGPIWARFYDLDATTPYVCDRDGVPRRHLEEIGKERRNGYSWFNDLPAELYPIYEVWAAKYDPQNKVDIDLKTKGANENGTIAWQ